MVTYKQIVQLMMTLGLTSTLSHPAMAMPPTRGRSSDGSRGTATDKQKDRTQLQTDKLSSPQGRSSIKGNR
jgi:hypothetical protein